VPAPISFSGWIPTEFSTQIIQEATQQSVALQLCNRVNMGTSVVEMPVPKTFPSAGWTSGAGARKPWTDLAVDTETMKAEELAAVVAIPNQYVEDVTMNVWGYVRPLVAEAMAAGLDDAVLFGEGAPASFPAGGVAGAAFATPDGTDAFDTVNSALAAVENSGVAVTGTAADLGLRSALRNVRDTAGDLIAGSAYLNERQVPGLFGYPIVYVPFSETSPDLITGAWRYAILGVRSDIRYELSNQGVIVDSAGVVKVSAFQDNQTLLKAWGRFAFTIVRPVTRRCPNGATPFAKATIAEGAVRCAPAPTSEGGDNGGTAEPTAARSGARQQAGRKA
jgi:HK97 family phage major capsid protein